MPDPTQRVLRHYLNWLDTNNLNATTATANDIDRYLDHWQQRFTTAPRSPPLVKTVER